MRVTSAHRIEFYEACLMRIHQNDPNVLSLDVDYRGIVGIFHGLQCFDSQRHGITRFIEALAVNSTLLELSILFQQLTEVVATKFVEALKPNSTLTRLNLKDNPIDDAAATQLSNLLRFNTTLLSLDLSQTALTQNGISLQRCQ